MAEKRLYKSNQHVISGVLGGIAEYFKIDPTWVRVIYAVLTFFTVGFPGVVLYAILALVIPSRPQHPDYLSQDSTEQQSSTKDSDWSDF
ncbi:PspC domain-containing protein [Loigolactobacillus zhaoyuanensis]|uniref:PspC domain-containing protein n=1 Tax=Loigolactobacillus zhaoyuanensis TaxID=2486017 RepID=A0ABW8UET8_9LACO|nr:PspC domain-containing protein [Loigolactobacillus zhaoyuanensis]